MNVSANFVPSQCCSTAHGLVWKHPSDLLRTAELFMAYFSPQFNLVSIFATPAAASLSQKQANEISISALSHCTISFRTSENISPSINVQVSVTKTTAMSSTSQCSSHVQHALTTSEAITVPNSSPLIILRCAIHCQKAVNIQSYPMNKQTYGFPSIRKKFHVGPMQARRKDEHHRCTHKY